MQKDYTIIVCSSRGLDVITQKSFPAPPPVSLSASIAPGAGPWLGTAPCPPGVTQGDSAAPQAGAVSSGIPAPACALFLEAAPTHHNLWSQAAVPGVIGEPSLAQLNPRPLGLCLDPVSTIPGPGSSLGTRCARLLLPVSPGVLSLESFSRRFTLQ